MIASGATSATSRATAATIGVLRSDRMIPPGPTLSAMCMKMPCRAGTSMSAAQAAIPPTLIATMTKSAPVRASRWLVVATTLSCRPLLPASWLERTCMVAKRASSMSISRSSAPSKHDSSTSRRTRPGTNIELPPPMTAILTVIARPLPESGTAGSCPGRGRESMPAGPVDCERQPLPSPSCGRCR